MSSPLDRALRDTMNQLADGEPPPPGLAPVAIRTARRQRRTRMAVTGLAAVAVGLLAAPAALSALPSGDGDGGGVQPGGGPSAGWVVTAYSDITQLFSDDPDVGESDRHDEGESYQDSRSAGDLPTGADGQAESLLLDRASGEYVPLPYSRVVPSPDGTQAIVHTGDGSPEQPLEVGVLDTATGEVDWIEGYTGWGSGPSGEWSPDGTEILLTEAPRLAAAGFVIVDAQTLAADFVPHDDVVDPALNAAGATYQWAPDGAGIVLVTSTAEGGEDGADQLTGIAFYDRAGSLTATLPVTASGYGADLAFSPDASRIALLPRSVQAPVQIIDARTGELLATVSAGTRLVGWAGEDHLVVIDDQRGGPATAQALQVVDLDGEIIDEIDLLHGESWVGEVAIGPAGGLPESSPAIIFGP